MTFQKKAIAQAPSTVEQVIGAAAADLRKGLEAFQSSVEHIAGLGQRAEDLQLKISNRNKELAGLDQEYTEKERQLTVAMGLNLKEKGLDAATELLRQHGREHVSSAEYGKLKSDYAGLQNDYKDDLNRAIATAVNTAKAGHEADMKLKAAEHKQQEAENTAKISSQADQIVLLKGQVDMLTKQLDAERAAGVQRAQANVAPVVNVGGQR